MNFPIEHMAFHYFSMRFVYHWKRISDQIKLFRHLNISVLLKYFLFTSLFFLSSFSTRSQVVKSIVLDSVVVQAVKKGFSVEDFIEMVKADTSFLRAFRYLRNSEHAVVGNMTIYGKRDRIAATRIRKAEQIIKGEKRWINLKDEAVTGKFYNHKEEPGSYTAEIFDDIFFYTDTLPVLSPSVSISGTTGTNNSGNINKLKKLVFNPGAEIDGVPIIGDRMAIFDDKMVKYYNYNIRVDLFNDSLSCYVFTCQVKPGSSDYPVVKSLKTWFDRKTFNIVYRDYQLQYSGMLFDFDVKMKVVMNNKGSEIYPSLIEYSGFWDIPMRKEERVDFELKFELD